MNHTEIASGILKPLPESIRPHSLESFVNGYWRFLERAPYSGWEEKASSAKEFISFIGPIYTPTPGYADAVLKLVPEAKKLLGNSDSSVPTPTNTTAKKLGTIVIDPGHGGTKTIGGSSPNNAISVSGVKEKKLALEFSSVLKNELETQSAKAGEAIKVILTRETDKNLGLKTRANFAYDNAAKLFICIHFNGNVDKSIRGVETFYQAESNGNRNFDSDVEFCKLVQASLFSSMKQLDGGAKDRGIKPDTDTNPGKLGVLRDNDLTAPGTSPACRAAYVELDFITNDAVEELLVSGADSIQNRQEIMASLARDIRGYMATF
jgi:N-acetylmuramoyl-L-alanine amidase